MSCVAICGKLFWQSIVRFWNSFKAVCAWLCTTDIIFFQNRFTVVLGDTNWCRERQSSIGRHLDMEKYKKASQFCLRSQHKSVTLCCKSESSRYSCEFEQQKWLQRHAVSGRDGVRQLYTRWGNNLRKPTWRPTWTNETDTFSSFIFAWDGVLLIRINKCPLATVHCLKTCFILSKWAASTTSNSDIWNFIL